MSLLTGYRDRGIANAAELQANVITGDTAAGHGASRSEPER
jgi:hypothetical protein